MTSNKEKGDRFEMAVSRYFDSRGIKLEPQYKVKIGFGSVKKEHSFDLGNEQMLVECKNFTWTSGGNSPSAKLSSLAEVMLIFQAIDAGYSKLLFMAKSRKNAKRNSETLVEHYIKSYGHLIPSEIEIWEFDETNLTAEKKFPTNPASAQLGGKWKETRISRENIDRNRRDLLDKLGKYRG